MFPKISALVLAAGSARRMKIPKLFMDFGGYPLISWCLRSIQKVPFEDRVLVVGDKYQDAIFTLSLLKEASGVDIIINQNFSQGMSTSLKAGISVVNKNSQAILLLLADMPFISVEIMHTIINTFAQSQKEDSIIVPVYKGRQGHPVLIPCCYFQEIERIEGDKGAKEILQRHKEKVCLVESPGPEIIFDIDTKEEWQKWKNLLF